MSAPPSRRARRIVTTLSRPSDAWLASRILGWALVARTAKYIVSLPALVHIVGASPRMGRRDADRERRILAFARWAGRVVRPREQGSCLERSLVSYRYLALASADPHLMIGFSRGETGVLGHAWVVVDGQPVTDAPGTVEAFQVVLSFDPGRNPVRAAGRDQDAHSVIMRKADL
jgi:hypothetical protein